MKKWLMVAMAATLAGAALHVHAQHFVNILTGGSSGVYYPLGVALSQQYKEVLPKAKIQVQATKASVENLNLLERGRGELAFALADSVADAWTGVADAGFSKPLKNLRTVGAIYPNYIHIVARADSGIRTLADLKGKRISVGAPRSGTELNARAVFGAAGLSYQVFSRIEYLPYSESVELMKNRQLDATLQSSGLGMAAFRDLAATVPVVFIPIPAEVVARIGNGAYQASHLPAGTYEGQKEAVPTVAISNLLMTRQLPRPKGRSLKGASLAKPACNIPKDSGTANVSAVPDTRRVSATGCRVSAAPYTKAKDSTWQYLFWTRKGGR